MQRLRYPLPQMRYSPHKPRRWPLQHLGKRHSSLYMGYPRAGTLFGCRDRYALQAFHIGRSPHRTPHLEKRKPPHPNLHGLLHHPVYPLRALGRRHCYPGSLWQRPFLHFHSIHPKRDHLRGTPLYNPFSPSTTTIYQQYPFTFL